MLQLPVVSYAIPALVAVGPARPFPRPTANPIVRGMHNESVERSRTLHEAVVLLTVQKTTTPVVPAQSRYEFADLGDGFYRLVVSFGYME